MSELAVHSGPLACKEWGAVVRALLAGEQIIDIRKGGLREPGRSFGLASDRFVLYPTVEHQAPTLLKPAYRDWVDPIGERVGEDIIIGGWADVMHHVTISDPGELEALEGRHIWSADYAEARLRWKPRDPLWVLVLRVHRFLTPITVADRPEYHGCVSWMTLEDVPANIYDVPSEPALTDEAFAGRVGSLPPWLQP